MNFRFGLALMFIVVASAACQAQVGGNIGFSDSGVKARAEQQLRARRTPAETDKPPSGTSTFVEANVLMNVKADEFVASFGIAQEAETVADCSRKMDAVAAEFTQSLKALGLTDADLYLDFVSQTRVYGYEITGEIVKEKLVGFELKKNMAIHYKDRDLIDKLTVAASRSKIDDLIKVDYVVKDIEPIQDRLMAEASRIIKKKTARYENLLGIKLQPPAQIYAESYLTTFPTTMYDSYVAAATEDIIRSDHQRFTVQSLRKSRGAVYNGLDADGFDMVINPVLTEPVVQFTLHLKIKYEVEQARAR